MKVSMDGLRSSLHQEVYQLRRIATAIIDGEDFCKHELLDVVNDLIASSNFMNCCFVADDEDFTDMSEIFVPMIGEEKLTYTTPTLSA